MFRPAFQPGDPIYYSHINYSYSATLKKSDEGVEQDCVVGEVRLLGGQPIDDRLVESRHKDVDASQGEDEDNAGKNSDFKFE